MDNILLKFGIDRQVVVADRAVNPKPYRNQKILLLAFAAALTPFTAWFGFSAPEGAAMVAGPLLALMPALAMLPFYAISDALVYGELQREPEAVQL